MIKAGIVIIGGGLTGLTLNYLLRKENLKTVIIESRDRLGGRVYTYKNGDAAPLEMGATWLQSPHTSLIALLKELNIGIFPQEMGNTAIYQPDPKSPAQLVQLPPNYGSSYRIQGGTSALIEMLAKHLSNNHLHLNETIKSITDSNNELIIKSDKNIFQSKIVISTLPPNLLKKTIDVVPNLPSQLLELMGNTHTWMGESIKVGFSYKKPFWREKNTSGTIFSSAGPITEFYDHANYEDNLFALKGFVNGNYHSLSKEDRLKAILMQLRKYYGNVVDDYIEYKEVVWRTEKETFVDYENFVSAHQNNGHPLYQQPYLNGKLYIGGAETSKQFAGYMDGAVRNAQFIYKQIQHK